MFRHGIACHVIDARDFFMLKSGPHQIEFGHVCENPHEWEQRYEKKDLAKHRHQGQVVATGLYCSCLSALKRYLSLCYLSTAAHVSLVSVTSRSSSQMLTLVIISLFLSFCYLSTGFLLTSRCLSLVSVTSSSF
jgi:hypothetical protein